MCVCVCVYVCVYVCVFVCGLGREEERGEGRLEVEMEVEQRRRCGMHSCTRVFIHVWEVAMCAHTTRALRRMEPAEDSR